MHAVFSAVCGCPDKNVAIRAHIGSPDLVTAEESGTLWLWAWPELLGWPAPITWLFSPVARKYPWPGDLWGVDAHGDLIIVETKAARGNRGQDPFRDFIGYEARMPKSDAHSVFESRALRRRWDFLLAKEEKFIDENLDNLRSGVGVEESLPGIVPYSCKRVEVWRWRVLYLDKIAPKILAQSYREAVGNNLAARELQRNTAPHYVGLLTVCGDGKPGLSKKGLEGYKSLREDVVAATVRLIAVKAEPRSDGKVEISSCRIL